MSINLSPRQLDDPGLSDDLSRLLAEHDVPPERVMLEITESVLMADDALGAQTLDAVRAAGVRLAIDDFGTGFSSLAYLRTLPVDVLKIDRAFISGAHSVLGDESLVASIVDMARRLGLSTVAEGVETEEQLAAIQSMGCDLAQGFLLGRPLESPAVDELL